MRRSDYQNWFALVGRLLMCCIFLVSAYAKITEWHGSVAMLAAKGLPAPQLLLAAATIVELVGGLAILTGLFARQAAFIVFLYLIPVTLLIHNFWGVGPSQMTMQMVNFLKNLAIMGGLLYISAYGPGRLSFGKERYQYDEEYRLQSEREAKPAQRV